MNVTRQHFAAAHRVLDYICEREDHPELLADVIDAMPTEEGLRFLTVTDLRVLCRFVVDAAQPIEPQGK